MAIFGTLFVFSFHSNAISAQTLFEDFDQDGLSNEEESVLGTDPYNADTDGDGYSDYTEISGGYDPLKPAPGDKIIPEEETPEQSVKENASGDAAAMEEDIVLDDAANITRQTAAKLAGIASEAVSEGSDVSLDTVEELVGEALAEAEKPVELPEVDEDEIRLLEQDYDDLDEEERLEREREDSVKYLSSIAYIAASTMPEQIDFTDQNKAANIAQNEITKSITQYTQGNYGYIEEWIERGEESLELLREVEVPENMLDIHKRGLQIALYAISLEEISRPNTDDPIGNIANLARAQGLLALVADYQQDVSQKLEDLNINDIPLEL